VKPIFRRYLEQLAARWQRAFGSLRAQLIVGNVIALSLLVGGLGVACRVAVFQFMMQSVNDDLERGIHMFLRPPPHEFSKFDKSNPRPPRPPDDGFNGNRFNGNEFHGGEHGPPGPPPGESNHWPRPPGANNPYGPHLFRADGKSEIETDKRAALDADGLARALRGETVNRTVTIDDEPVQVLSSPSFDHQGRKGAVQNAYPLKEVYRAIGGIDTALLLLIPVGLLGAVWLGSALTTRVLRRVHRLTQAAERIGAQDFSRRLPYSGSDEFSELAQTFNGLLGRLERAFQEQKRLLQLQQRFTADASHELKTPLTIIKGRAGLALNRASTDERSRHTFQEIEAATDTMSHLVQDLLLLARSDEGQMGRDRMELLIGDILETAKTQALQEDSAPVTWRVRPEDLTVMGNEGELIRLFRNLLDNAAHYTPPKGSIHIAAHCENDNVVVTVEDAGTGIAPEHLPHLGERFYRVDASRTRPSGGTGLGLSICRSIVEAHGGTLTFKSAPGVGTTVTVTLPQATTRYDPAARFRSVSTG
jgi:signal transduction histidine kinase